MPSISAFQDLSFVDQLLHGLHFMMCAFAVLVACLPLMTAKGSLEHKVAGLIYLPLSFIALLFASFMAWRETSLILFCFNSFCTYLLLSGWRAVRAHEKPNWIDWVIPGFLFVLAILVSVLAVVTDEGTRSFYLLFFALNAFYLSSRDIRQLRERAQLSRHKIFFPGLLGPSIHASEWINRHVAGMVGSVLANLSVVVLTLLPLSLHWLWPTILVTAGLRIAWKERQKKERLRQALAPILKPVFRPRPESHDDDEPFHRAA